MKLKELLKNIGFDQKVQILEFYQGLHENKDEVLFEGDADKVPWKYADYVLDTDFNGEAIFAFIPDDTNEAWIGIYVREAYYNG